MSKPRRGANGAGRTSNESSSRFRAIRALWFAVHNDPNHSVSDLAAEFYYKVGELLEGKPLDSLTYHRISKERVLAHSEEP